MRDKGDEKALLDLVYKAFHGLAVLGSLLIVLLTMFGLGCCLGALHCKQEHVDKQILEMEILVSDETQEVKMTIGIGTPRHLKDFGLDYRMSVVPQAVR